MRGRPLTKPGERKLVSRGLAQSKAGRTFLLSYLAPFIKQFMTPHELFYADAGTGPVHKPAHLSEDVLQGKLDMFFCRDTRHIWCVEATESFNIQAPMWDGDKPGRPFTTGFGKRKVKRGDRLWVRFDTTQPTVRQVEFHDQVFVIDDAEWNVISEKLEEIG